jgi:hypothetical protein
MKNSLYYSQFQERILDFFIDLGTKNQNRAISVFSWPGVKEFLSKEIADLNSNLEPKAYEILKKGDSIIFKFQQKEKNIVKFLLEELGKRFSKVKESFDEQLLNIKSDFFNLTGSKFLSKYEQSIQILKNLYPFIYEIFVCPLQSFLSKEDCDLFKFFCNPHIYGSIMIFLTQNHSSLDRSKKHLESLNENLKRVKSISNEESWKELTKKSNELLKSSNDLEPFVNLCSGFLGEIKAIEYIFENIYKSGDTLIILENENYSKKKKKMKNCDLMLIHSSDDQRSLFEVKTKSERHGVENSKSIISNDFILNFIPSISSYLEYIFKVGAKYDLNLRESFPLFLMYEDSDYGKALPLENHITKNLNNSNEIEDLLDSCFMKHTNLSCKVLPLPTKEEKLLDRKKSIHDLFKKPWVETLMKNGVDQLMETRKYYMKMGHQISKLYLVLNISLSYRLRNDPLSHSDANIKDYATEKLKKIFLQFKEKKEDFDLNGIEIELVSIL